MHSFSFYSQAQAMGEMHNLVLATINTTREGLFMVAEIMNILITK
jgi:hypothetical protein